MTPGYDYGVQTSNNCNNFVFFSLLCSYYVNDIIKKLELHLLVVTILFKTTEFGHAQISVPKIGKPMPKTACFSPWLQSFRCCDFEQVNAGWGYAN